MTKLDAGLVTPLPASDSGSAAVWGSKRINPRPQSCLCLAWSGCPSNDDDDDEHRIEGECDRHGCYLKPTKVILLCPGKRYFTTRFFAWWSWQAPLNKNFLKNKKIQADCDILHLRK